MSENQKLASVNKAVPIVLGIIKDLQTLVQQEVEFATNEVRSEIRVIKSACMVTALAVLFSALAALMFAFSAAHLLMLSDRIPAWAAYLILSSAFGVSAIFSIRAVKRTLSSQTT